MTEVAHGEIRISVTDRDALADLERVREQYRRTMASINNDEARARIDADIKPFQRELEKAKRELRELQGQKAQQVRLGIDDQDFNKRLKAAQLRVKELDGQKAKIEIKVEGEREALAAQKRLQQADAQRFAASERLRREESQAVKRQLAADMADERRRMQAVNQRARVSAALRRQEAQELSSAHAMAMRMDKERDQSIYQQTVGIAKQRAQVIQLQREYAKLTDRAEGLARQRRYTTEGRAKLELDRADVEAKMLAIKAELNALGSHPPVDIKVDIARTTLGRVKQDFGRMIAGMAEQASRLGEMSVRIGPFTTSLKGLGIALAFLGPTITDIAGALGSLIGVTGAGLAGAATVGAAGVAGLGLGFLGLKFSVRNAGQEITNARSTIDAYGKAVQKYGKDSDQAKKAQDQMNSTLKAISPLAREAALGVEKFYANWDKRTEKTREHLGSITKNGFEALNAITPAWAKSTNRLSGIIDRNLSKAFDFVKSSEFKSNFSAITDNFNAMMPSILRGLGNLGRAFLNFGREGSRFLPQMGRGFENLSRTLLRFTQGDDFGKTIKGWVDSAKDLGRFFSAATQVAVHFFGAGTKAGQGLLQSMTGALNKYDDFLTSAGGRNTIADAFERAADGTRALWNLLAPIGSAFITWASNLSPFITGITTVFGFVSKLVGMLGKVTGMAGAFSALGVTIGAAFAVSKISGMIAGLARVVTLLRTIRTASEVSTLGGLGAAWKGTSGGTPIPVGMGGAAAKTAVEAERAAASAGRLSQGFSRAKIAAGGLITGLTGLSPVTAAVTAATLGLGYALLSAATRTSDYTKKTREANAAQQEWQATSESMPDALGQQADAVLNVRRANLDLHQAQKEVNRLQAQGETNTDEYKYALLNLKQAQGQVATAHRVSKQAAQSSLNTQIAATRASQKEAKAAADAVTGLQDRNTDAAKAAEAIRYRMGRYGESLDTATKKVRAMAKEQKGLFAENKGLKSVDADDIDQAVKAMNRYGDAVKDVHKQQQLNELATLNLARASRGLQPIAAQAAAAFARINQQSKGLSRTISLKFTDSGNAAKVAQSAASALKSGVPTKIVTKIVAQSSDAEQAIRRINQMKLAAKNLNILQSGGPGAVAMLQRITGITLSPKQQRIAEQGGSGVMAMLGRILGVRIPNKAFAVIAHDQASGVIAHLNQLTLTPKYQDIYTRVHNAGGSGQIHGGAAQATGGGSGANYGAGVPVSKMAAVGRAAKDALNHPVAKALSQKVTAPRYLVGEERGGGEYIIATNPAYKKDNLRYLRQAAAALGQNVIPAAVGYGKGAAAASGIGGGETAMTRGAYAQIPEYTSAKKRPRKKFKGKPTTSNKSIAGQIKQRRGWTGYIEYLQTSEQDWEREVGIRQGAVREPEDMVVQVGEKPVVDKKGKPVTDEDGKQITAPIYAENPDIQNQYIPDLQAVLEAFRTLMGVLRELVRAIPLAQDAVDVEIGARKGVIGKIKAEIDKNKAHLKHATKADSKDKFRKEIQKLKSAQGSEENTIKDLLSDKKTLGDARKESGFSLRDQAQGMGDVQDELGSVLNKAITEAGTKTSDEYASAQGSGGGSSSDTPANTGNTRSQDILLADSARTDIYKQFAGNSSPATARPTSVASLASPNLAPNAGGLGTMLADISAPSGGGSSAGGIMLQASSAGSALGGSRAAGLAVQAPGVALSGGIMGGTSAGAASSTTVVNINNTFATVPPDPHSWSKGVQFELGSAIG